MANCNACKEIMEKSSNLVVNGVTTTICNNVKSGKGIEDCTYTGSIDDKNCTDLNNANDCLIGNLTDELEAYEICDWKKFMRKFVPNTYNMFKLILCWLCGIWKKLLCINSSLQDIVSAPVVNFDENHVQYINGCKVWEDRAKGTKAYPNLVFSGTSYRFYCPVQFPKSWKDLEGKSGADPGYGIMIVKIKKSELENAKINSVFSQASPFMNITSGTLVISFYAEGDTAYYTRFSDGEKVSITVPTDYVYGMVRLVNVNAWGGLNSILDTYIRTTYITGMCTRTEDKIKGC